MQIESEDERTKYREYQEQLKRVRVLDPACGSGAFLLSAYQFLLRQHDQLNERLKGLGETEFLEGYDLSCWILKENLFGVDINEASIEITKLSLWLETAEKNRRLVDLDSNIKVGNSLIDDPKIAGEKAFVWKEEFPEILAQDGFDVIIGNPPWGADVNLSKSKDSSEYFIARSLHLLNSETGYFSFILPKSILFAEAWNSSREMFFNYDLKLLSDSGIAFEKVNLESCIVVLRKNTNLQRNHKVTLTRFKPKFFSNIKFKEELQPVLQEIMQKSSTLILSEFSDVISNIIGKVQSDGSFLKDFRREVFRGIYIPDVVKSEILDQGDTQFINKVPEVSRYHIDRIRRINLFILFQKGKKYEHKVQQLKKERIIIKVLRGKYLSATIAPENVLSTEKLVNLIVDEKELSKRFVLCFLNSKLVSFYLSKVIFSDITETARVMDDCYLKKIPMKKLNFQKQAPFVDLADSMLGLHSELHRKNENFLRWIQNELRPEKINTKIKKPYLHSEEEVIKELKQQKIMPSKRDKIHFSPQQTEEFYEEHAKLKHLYSQIQNTEKEIDERVFDLYKLTQEEREVVLSF